MINNEILVNLSRLFSDLTGNQYEFDEETQAKDVPEWDSLNHISFIISIEQFYNVKFTRQEIKSWKNISEICNSISAKIQ